MKNSLLTLVAFMCIVHVLPAQVGINTNSPDPSAALDITSTDKGLLLPRVDTASVVSPANGLLVLQHSNDGIYKYNGSFWEEIGGISSLIQDLDKDTKIYFDKTLDDDIIRMNIEGREVFRIISDGTGRSRIEFLDNNFNIAIGNSSLEKNTTGQLNVGMGVEALKNNTIGTANTAIGTSTLLINDSGSDNTAIGSNAMQNNETGNENVALGSSAMGSNTTGSSNVALGKNALVQNSTGSFNVAVGRFALNQSLWHNNVALGDLAGRSTTLGNNTFIGARSGETNDGSGNVFLGSNSGSLMMGNNKLVIENSDADSTEALIYGEFDNNLLRLNAEVNINGEYSLPTTIGAPGQMLMVTSPTEIGWNNAQVNVLADTDSDTKIQVEKTADDDQISFDIAGTEKYVIKNNTHGMAVIEQYNNNESVIIGQLSGDNTSGGKNTFLGYRAGRENTTGDYNTYIGKSAGEQALGNHNVLMGESSGGNLDGEYNTLIGVNAGTNLEGDENLILGNYAGYFSKGDGNVLLGNNAGYSSKGGNKLYIENTSADSTEALIYGEFDNDLLRLNAEVNINGDYILPVDTSTIHKYMVMGANNQLEWQDKPKNITLTDIGQNKFSFTEENYNNGVATTFGFVYIYANKYLADSDGNTKIDMDKYNNNDDQISFEMGGFEKLVMKKNASGQMVMEIKNNDDNVIIGEDAGQGTNGLGDYNTMIGHSAGKQADGFSNVFIGSEAGTLTDGWWNTFVGRSAGGLSNTGDQNTFIGEVSGELANGKKNSYLGVGAGRNIQGDNNIAFGFEAGKNATGDKNVLLGSEAGKNSYGGHKLYIENTSADSTEALIYGEFDNNLLRLNAEVNINGEYSLPTTIGTPGQVLTVVSPTEVAWDSTYIDLDPSPINEKVTHFNFTDNRIDLIEGGGHDTLSAYLQIDLLADEDYDTKIQVEKTADNDQISFDIAGTEKLIMKNNASDELQMSIPTLFRNIFIGDKAGDDNDPASIYGQDNTFIGYSSGEENNSGSANTYLGSVAGSKNISGLHNTFIGAYAGENNLGKNNTFIGSSAGVGNVNGDGNVFIGQDAGFNQAGSNKLIIENTNADTTGALIYGDFVNDKLRINGKLGINTTPNYSIHINETNSNFKLANTGNSGSTQKSAANYWRLRLSNNMNVESSGIFLGHTAFESYEDDALTLGSSSFRWKEIYAMNTTVLTSDKRYKKNIHDAKYGLEAVMQMRPVTYQWKKEENGRVMNGFIAQEMEKVVPEVVVISQNKNRDGRENTSEFEESYGMRYTELIPVLTKAIQEQQNLIDKQNTTIDMLIKRVEALEEK